MIEDNKQLFNNLQRLVEAWCDRRCLRALRNILPGYPLISPLSDGWSELLIALQDVRAFARDELTAEEQEIAGGLHSSGRSAVHRTGI